MAQWDGGFQRLRLSVGHPKLWAAKSAGSASMDGRGSEVPIQASLRSGCSYERTTFFLVTATCTVVTASVLLLRGDALTRPSRYPRHPLPSEACR